MTPALPYLAEALHQLASTQGLVNVAAAIIAFATFFPAFLSVNTGD